MGSYTLQIIHKPLTGGENVIEMHFDKVYQAEAEQRRHKKMKHTADCETYVIMEPHGDD